MDMLCNEWNEFDSRVVWHSHTLNEWKFISHTSETWKLISHFRNFLKIYISHFRNFQKIYISHFRNFQKIYLTLQKLGNLYRNSGTRNFISHSSETWKLISRTSETWKFLSYSSETWKVTAADGAWWIHIRWKINFAFTFETAPFFCEDPVQYLFHKFFSELGVLNFV